MTESSATLDEFRHKFVSVAPNATLKPLLSLAEFESLLVQSNPSFLAVFIDQALARRAGSDRMRRLSALLGSRPMLLFAGNDNPADVLDGINCGASGYLAKTSSGPTLGHAVGLALQGEGYAPMPPGILHARVRSDVSGNPEPVLDQLTDRQRDVFELLLSGRSNKEIARDLGVLEGTVKVHVRAIMQKLGVRNRTQVAVVAARSGLLARTKGY